MQCSSFSVMLSGAQNCVGFNYSKHFGSWFVLIRRTMVCQLTVWMRLDIPSIKSTKDESLTSPQTVSSRQQHRHRGGALMQALRTSPIWQLGPCGATQGALRVEAMVTFSTAARCRDFLELQVADRLKGQDIGLILKLDCLQRHESPAKLRRLLGEPIGQQPATAFGSCPSPAAASGPGCVKTWPVLLLSCRRQS